MIIRRRSAFLVHDEWTDLETVQYQCDWCGSESKESSTEDLEYPYANLAGWELVVAGRGARRNMCPECVPAEKP